MSNTSATFVLRSIKTKGTSKLSCQVRGEGLALMVSTPIKVDVIAWRKAHHAGASKSALKNYNASAEGVRVASQIAIAEGQVIAAVDEGVKDGKTIAKRIANALILDDAKKTAAEAERLQESCVLPYIDNFIANMEKGMVKTSKKKDFDPSTQNYYKNMRKYLGESIKEDATLTFNDLNADIVDNFIKWMEDANIMRSTQKNILACVAAITRRAWNAGLLEPSKVGVLDLWKMPNPNKEEVKAEIALSEEEVNALWEYSNRSDISSKEKLVADMALAGIESLQRFSDFSRFDPSMVHDIDGRKYIVFTQEKTNYQVHLPYCGMVSFRLAQLMERNHDSFVKLSAKKGEYVPKLGYSAFCNNFRSIMHEISNSVPTLNEVFVTPLSHDEILMEKDFMELQAKREAGALKTASNEYYRWLRDSKLQKENGAWGTKYLFQRNGKGEVVKYKWQLVSSHTCRRTGITIALDKGIVSREQIKRVSGHLTDKAFNRYDHRDARKMDNDIYDAVMEASERGKANVVSMAVNQ